MLHVSSGILKLASSGGILLCMNTIRYVYWQDGDMWLGYLEEFPDYMTQGETLEELQDNLRDIRTDILGGEIPGVRHVAELPIA
jgi:predicted RNase H-like HicB family nuclease